MRRSFISLVAGILMASLAVFLVSQYKGSPGAAPRSGKGEVNVVVAARDLPFGTDLLRDHLKYARWPEASVPAGAFTNIDDLVNDAEKKGKRVILRATFAGEPVLQQKVSGFGDKSTLSRKVSSDKRAYSVRVNDVSGVAGFLLPGDRVDIMLTRSPEGQNNNNLVTDVILQNVMILGIDQLTDEGSEKPVLARTITLEVTADEAQKLALAQQLGSLSLTLRSYTDNQQAQTGRVSAADLIVNAAVPAEDDGGESRNVVRVRRGMSVN